ncbi:hypothetical protein [Streptomyces sp. NPDC053367]|uniref:hypothetical protein n=1 Tax=Streptomyces sp. NPDC053367 TaxID=3365700 RepID=UPI0037D23BB3
MTSSSSGFVAALTAAAVATVGFLTYQASANVPPELGRPHPLSPSDVSLTRAPRDTRHPAALPPGSGSGERVVYSVDDDRVWLVGPRHRILRTFEVTPGTVDPAPGTYTVSSRSSTVTGTDGTPIEHVVRFASVRGVSVGFSAARDGSTPRPDPRRRTGGIRESREDGDAMWEFATIGRKVVVIR